MYVGSESAELVFAKPPVIKSVSPLEMGEVPKDRIVDFGDFIPSQNGQNDQVLGITGPLAFEFNNQEKTFMQTKKGNTRLQVFNVVLGLIVSEEEAKVSAGEVVEIIGGTQRADLAAVRRSMFLLGKIGLIETLPHERRKSRPETVATERLYRAPDNVAVIYNRETHELEPVQPRKRKLSKPIIASDMLRPSNTLPEENPKHNLGARCAGKSFELFHPGRGEPTEPAKLICQTCVQRPACLEYALANHIKSGIWGGTSGRQRREIARLRALNATQQV